MSVRENFDSMVERIQEHASVKSVYGEPVEAEGKTIIPVAKISYGFGGGFGSEDEEDESEEIGDENGEGQKEHEESGGIGGGASAKPVGVLEVTEDQTRFIRYENRKKLLGVAFLGLLLGLILGKK